MANCYINPTNSKAKNWLKAKGYILTPGKLRSIYLPDVCGCGEGVETIKDVLYVNFAGSGRKFHKMLAKNGLLSDKSIPNSDVIYNSWAY